eukprot:COSAG04_NODE_1318_length_7243_cov_8.351204_3_plen_110_part_00
MRGAATGREVELRWWVGAAVGGGARGSGVEPVIMAAPPPPLVLVSGFTEDLGEDAYWMTSLAGPARLEPARGRRAAADRRPAGQRRGAQPDVPRGAPLRSRGLLGLRRG